MSRDSGAMRMARTVTLTFTWINMGFNGNMLYAVLPDLLIRTNSTVEEMSVAFAIGGVGGLFVPFFVIVVDKFVYYEQLVLGGFCLVVAVTITLKGFATHVWQIAIYHTVEGFIWGCINAVGQSVILRMWGHDSGPAMQALHLGYPIGAFLGPMVAVPFVSDTAEEEGEESVNATSLSMPPPQCQPYPAVLYTDLCMSHSNIHDIQGNIFTPSSDAYYSDVKNDDIDTWEFADDSSIEIALGIAGVFTAIVASVHLALHFMQGKKQNQDEETSASVEEKVVKESYRTLISPKYWAEGKTVFGITVLTLITLFFICHIGSTLGIIMYLVTYAVDSGFTNQEAAWLQAAVNFSAAAARATSILITKYVSINIMLNFELHGQLLFVTLMLLLGSQSATALWVTSCLYAVFREPTWPSGMTWPNSYIMMIGFLFSVMMICISIFSIPLNLLIGFLYTNTTPESIFQTSIVFNVLNCLVLYAMFAVTCRAPKRSIQTEDEGEGTKNGTDKPIQMLFNNEGFERHYSIIQSENSSSPVLLQVAALENTSLSGQVSSSD